MEPDVLFLLVKGPESPRQRQKLWSSRNGARNSKFCTYQTSCGHWTESCLNPLRSPVPCKQCWQHWELNRWRICHCAMSYKGTGNQDGGSCGWQWAPKVILSLVKRSTWLCFFHRAKQRLPFGWKGCTATSTGIAASVILIPLFHGSAMPTSSLQSTTWKWLNEWVVMRIDLVWTSSSKNEATFQFDLGSA